MTNLSDSHTDFRDPQQAAPQAKFAEYGDAVPKSRTAYYVELEDSATPEEVQKVIDEIAARFHTSNLSRKPPYHEATGSEIVYRGHNGILVVHKKVPGPKGDLVDGHYYEIGSQEECLEITGFQNGPVPQVGVNGVTTEAFLAMNIHRLEVLDALFPCEENKRAIVGMKDALGALEERTANRLKRGVEGQNKI